MLNKLLEIIDSPFKSLMATIIGTITGYIPTTTNTLMNITSNTIDKIFQHTVWTLTSIVAITAIITWIQKQVDRYNKKKSDSVKNKSIYYEDEDDD